MPQCWGSVQIMTMGNSLVLSAEMKVFSSGNKIFAGLASNISFSFTPGQSPRHICLSVCENQQGANYWAVYSVRMVSFGRY